MEPAEHDVYISYREETGTGLAKLIAAGLARRGFHVVPDSLAAGSGRDESFLNAIEEAPDFVLLLTPNALDPCRDEGDRMRREIAHALTTERNIVPVYVPGFVRPRASSLPPDLASLPTRGGVFYNPGASRESVARIAHMLASDTTVDDRRLMRQAKRLFVTLGLALLAIVAFEVARALPRLLARPIDVRPLPPLALYWSGFGQRLDNGQWVEIEVRDGSRLRGGDQIRLVFSPSADGHAYVMSKDLRGEITALFPPHALKADSRVRAGELYEAPVDGGWFAVDDGGGVQMLYVLASYDPIENLESMIEERDEESSTRARLMLLDATIAGLLDGRHAQAGPGVRTRRGRPIVQSVEVPQGPRTASALLTSGLLVTHELTMQPGLVSAVREIRVAYEPVR